MTAFSSSPGGRSLSLARDRWALSALNLYAQVTVGLSLYLYDFVSTPSYLSILLAAPFLILLALAARRGLPGAALPRAVYLLPALGCLMDACLSFFALCAVMADVMPDMGLLGGALLCAGALALGLGGASPFALPRLARLLLWVITPLLLFCALSAWGYGGAAHFFPLLGYGPASIFRGAAWITGCLSSAVAPLFLSDAPQANALSESRRRVLLPLLLALGAGVLTAAVSAWLMPVYALSGDRTLGWRMLLITHMTPSVPCWSMEVMAVLLLLLLSLSVSVRRTALFLGRSFGKQGGGWVTALLLFLLAVPSGLQSAPVRAFLLRAAPGRAILMALPVIAAWVMGIRKCGKEGAA